jgi:hypothetical protein
MSSQDLLLAAANAKITNDDTRMTQISLGITTAVILFAVPLVLAYIFFVHKKNAWYTGILLFSIILGLGYTTNLLFYRVVVMNDIEAKIDNMSASDALFVLFTTLAAFMIVAITFFAISANKNMITIFENTFGFWFLHLWGLTDLCNDIFTSESLDKVIENTDTSMFNYNFLITRINLDNLDDFIEYAKKCEEDGVKNASTQLGLDFRLKFDFQNQIDKLKDMVHLKHTFGHFMWIYLACVVSLFVSMIGCIMGVA